MDRAADPCPNPVRDRSAPVTLTSSASQGPNMSTDPALPLAGGAASLREFDDPLLVDPTPALLTAVVEAYRATAPSLVDPDLAALRAATDGGADGGADTVDGDEIDGRAVGPDSVASPSDLPTLTVLASDDAVDAVTARFHSASRLAALVEAGICRLLTGVEPQPNAVLAGRSTGCVLVEREECVPAERDGDEHERSSRESDDRGWVRLGAEPSLRERYARSVAEADERRLRTPSRSRVYGAFRERCDEAVAADVIRTLDVDPEPSEGEAVAPRVRAYAVGVRRGALDHALRRACEDAGLGSRATFTRIKKDLRDRGLLATESVPQPVGRPRERLVARGALADTEGADAVVAAVRDGRE